MFVFRSEYCHSFILADTELSLAIFNFYWNRLILNAVKYFYSNVRYIWNTHMHISHQNIFRIMYLLCDGVFSIIFCLPTQILEGRSKVLNLLGIFTFAFTFLWSISSDIFRRCSSFYPNHNKLKCIHRNMRIIQIYQ